VPHIRLRRGSQHVQRRDAAAARSRRYPGYMGSTTWLYLRGDDAVRIVVQGPSITVHGPGMRVRRACFPDDLDAALYQASVEQALVAGGWLLDQRCDHRDAAIPALSSRC
jgi:hypothetical protein